MGFLCNLVLVIFVNSIDFVHIGAEISRDHDFGYSKKSFEEGTSICKKTVVSPQTRIGFTATQQASQDPCCSEEPSLTGRQLSCQHCSSNDYQSAMEMWRLPATSQTHGNVLSNMSATMAKHDRPYLCASTWRSPRFSHWKLELRPDDVGKSTRPPALESSKIQEQNSDAERTQVQKCTIKRRRCCTWTYGAISAESLSRKRPRQSFHPAFATTSDAPTGDNMDEFQHADAEHADDDDATEFAVHATSSANGTDADHSTATDCDVDGTQSPESYSASAGIGHRAEGVHGNGTSTSIRATSGHAPEDAKDDKEGGSASHKGPALSCQESRLCEKGCRRSFASEVQPHFLLEILPIWSSSNLARIHCTVPESGTRASRAHPSSSPCLCPSQTTSRTISGRSGENHSHRDQGRRGGTRWRPTPDRPLVGQDQRGSQESHSVASAAATAGRSNRDRGEGCKETSHICTTGCRGNGDWRRRTGIRGLQTAFCLARLCMTFTYDDLGLCRHWSSSTPASIMKWHNRAVTSENFTSEWRAREQAIGLSLEISGPSSTSISWFYSSSSQIGDRSGPDHVQRSRPRRPDHLHVGFADELEMWLGIEDSFRMYRIVVPLEIGASGCTPWSTPISQEAASSHHGTHVAANTDSSGNLQTFCMNSSPTWSSAIFDLLNREGQVEDEEEGPVVFVTSYYISHAHHRFHDQPRILRFDMEFLEWERDVRFMWEDLVDHAAPLDIVFVRPDPPHAAFRGSMATVIVHQHFDATRSACLLSTIHIMDPDTRFRESAHSVELRLQPARILQLAEVEQVCAQRQQDGAGPCTIHIGHHIQDPQQDVATFHGLGLQIRIPSRLTQSEAEQNLVSRLQRQRRHRQAHIWIHHQMTTNQKEITLQPTTKKGLLKMPHGSWLDDQEGFVVPCILQLRPHPHHLQGCHHLPLCLRM